MLITHISAPIYRPLLTLKRAVPGTHNIFSVNFNLFIGLPANLQPSALKRVHHMLTTHIRARIHRTLLTLKRAVPVTHNIVSVIFNLFIGLPAHLQPWALKRALHMLTTHISAHIHRSLLTLKRAVPGTHNIVSVIFKLFICLPAHLQPWALKRALHMPTNHISAPIHRPFVTL
jgi:hypothetical protein